VVVVNFNVLEGMSAAIAVVAVVIESSRPVFPFEGSSPSMRLWLGRYWLWWMSFRLIFSLTHRFPCFALSVVSLCLIGEPAAAQTYILTIFK